MTDPALSRPAPSPAEPVPDEFDLLCEACGYSLLGLVTDVCPECGRAFNPGELPLARVPWLYRKRLGRFTAYTQTVWRILTRPREFGKELCRPVRISPSDAYTFRRVTVWIAIINSVITLLVGAFIAIGGNLALASTRDWIEGSTFTISYIVGLWVIFWLATDLPTFIWKGLPANPEDLAPLHHYAAAGLSLMPLVGTGIVALVAFDRLFGASYLNTLVCRILAWLVAAVMLWKLWWIPQVLMQAATGCTIWRRLALAVYLPFHWALMILLGIAAGGVVQLILYSTADYIWKAFR